MTHEIPDFVRNSAVELCIDEYVRLERDRELLRDHWFRGLSFKALAQKYDIAENTVKNIIYGPGERVLRLAEKIST